MNPFGKSYLLENYTHHFLFLPLIMKRKCCLTLLSKGKMQIVEKKIHGDQL